MPGAGGQGGGGGEGPLPGEADLRPTRHRRRAAAGLRSTQVLFYFRYFTIVLLLFLQSSNKQPLFRGDLEVTYQCRPSRFRSRTMCRDDRDEISCPGRQLGLVILSASFVSVVDSHFFCPRGGLGPQLPASGVRDVMGECVSTSVSSGVEQRCHGHHHCAVEASPSLLSAPECEHLNVFLKVIYACVEQKNIIPSVPSQLNILGTQETDKSSTPDKNFTASIKNLETTTNSGIYKDELKIQDVEKLRRDKNEETFEQTQEILGVGKMTDKKMIYGSELKLLSDPHRKISNEHGDTAAAGRRRATETEADTFDINILENSPDDNLLSSLTEVSFVQRSGPHFTAAG